MHHTYVPEGVCSTRIDFDIEDGYIRNLVFTRGCNGNLKAIGKLVEGMDARKVSDILIGNTCGTKSTSCADQLSRAILKALSEESRTDGESGTAKPKKPAAGTAKSKKPAAGTGTRAAAAKSKEA